MPSAIHRDSLAPLIHTPSSTLLLSYSTTQDPANEEPVSSTPLSTSAQSNATHVPNVSHFKSVNIKSLKSNVDIICPLSPVRGRMSRTHSTDNSNGKSARYCHGINRFTPPIPLSRRNPLPSARRRLLCRIARKPCLWSAFAL